MLEDFDILLDYDGVILDSEERIVNLKDQQPDLSWDDFFEMVDWEKLYEESQEINHALEIIRELQVRRKNLYILTKCHKDKEAVCKIRRIRKEGIIIPTFVVPPHMQKHEVYIPNEKTILVDDSKKTIAKWDQAGGVGILFKQNEEEGPRKVKSLEFLLRG